MNWLLILTKSLIMLRSLWLKKLLLVKKVITVSLDFPKILFFLQVHRLINVIIFTWMLLCCKEMSCTLVVNEVWAVFLKAAMSRQLCFFTPMCLSSLTFKEESNFEILYKYGSVVLYRYDWSKTACSAISPLKRRSCTFCCQTSKLWIHSPFFSFLMPLVRRVWLSFLSLFSFFLK